MKVKLQESYPLQFRRVLVLVLVNVCLFVVGGCGSRKVAMASVEQQFIEKISKKDWRGIYMMASKEERAISGIGQEQFVRLMEVITNGFPVDLRCIRFAEFKSREQVRSFAVKLDAIPKFAPDVKERHGFLALQLKKSGGNWYPVFTALPFQLLKFRQEDKAKRRRQLLIAMEESRTPYLVMIDQGFRLHVEDQRRVVRGEIEQMEGFR